MMMITGGQKAGKKSKQGERFQILDVVDMMLPITKYASQIVAGDNIHHAFAKRIDSLKMKSRARFTWNCQRISPTSTLTKSPCAVNRCSASNP